MGKFIKSVRGRQWLYGVAIAVIALSAFYGLITDESTVLWIAVVAALLGLPVAAGNVTNGGITAAPIEDPDWPEGTFDPVSGARWAIADPHEPTESPDRTEQ